MKMPPYSHRLDTARYGRLLVVCTGSAAWQWAKFETWFPGAKIVLPPGDNPRHYDWRVADAHDVIIGGFGALESFEKIIALGGLLRAVGAQLVLYSPENGPLTRIDARRPAHGL